MLSPVPGASAAPPRGLADHLAGRGDPGQAGLVAERRRGELGQPARRSPGRSSRCRRRRRGRSRLGSACTAPARSLRASRQVSQSCGSMTRATRAAFSGSCSASQRSLVTVNDALGTLPVRSAHQPGPPSSAISSRAAAAERRSFHSRAGLTTCAGLVQRDHAVLLRRHRDRVGPVEQALPGLLQRGPPRGRVALGARRVRGARPGPRSCRLRPGTAGPWSTA